MTRLDQLRKLAREPVRAPMGRGVQFPSLAQQHLADELEIQRLRLALAEAISIVDQYRRQAGEA